MKKRTLSFFLVLTLALALVPLSGCGSKEEANADTWNGVKTAPAEDFRYYAPSLDFDWIAGWYSKYSWDPPDVYVITKYIGSDTVVKLPKEIHGHPVAGIGRYVFEDTKVTDVYLPETILSLDAWTFRQCPTLTGITVDKDNPCFYDVNGVLYMRGDRAGDLNSNSYHVLGESGAWYHSYREVENTEGYIPEYKFDESDDFYHDQNSYFDLVPAPYLLEPIEDVDDFWCSAKDGSALGYYRDDHLTQETKQEDERFWDILIAYPQSKPMDGWQLPAYTHEADGAMVP